MDRKLTRLTFTEEKHVRTALLNLRARSGVRAGWFPIADALGVGYDTLKHAVMGRRSVPPLMAFAVANLMNVSIGDLLEGRATAGMCPHCGHTPDFSDEATIVELDD